MMIVVLGWPKSLFGFCCATPNELSGQPNKGGQCVLSTLPGPGTFLLFPY